MATCTAFGKMTVEEFPALPETQERMELVDGEIFMSPKARFDHQRMVAYLGYLFLKRVEHNGFVVVDKDVVVQTEEKQRHVRVSDLCYIQESRGSILSDEAIQGPPDIVVEVLSDSTEEVDRMTKRDEYAATGVWEYWIVDMLRRQVLVRFFLRRVSGFYQAEDEFESGVLQSPGLPGRFSIGGIFGILRSGEG
ncbi:MAG: Uma2 family endonuclease [Planctomycetes bacterium]|nr:Uma2 family endonuclease [Planctomycetota bacterium]